MRTRLEKGAYPESLTVDSIHHGLNLGWSVFEGHRPFLTVLNDVTNAHKHSFIQSELNIVGADEPCVAALTLTRNRLAAQPSFYNVALADVAARFSGFMTDGLTSLRQVAKRLRVSGAT